MGLALAVLVGDLVTHGRTYGGLGDALLWGVLAGAAAALVAVLTVFYGDREMMGAVRERGRARRRGGDAG